MRATWFMLLLALSCACQRVSQTAEAVVARVGHAQPEKPAAEGSVTVSHDEAATPELDWQPPQVELQPKDAAQARRKAAQALAEGRLYAGADDAIPLYLALHGLAPEDRRASEGLDRSLVALLKQGEAALRDAGDDEEALRRAGKIAAVARAVDAGDKRVSAYLDRVDLAQRLWEINAAGERDLQAGVLGERGGGALDSFREALRLQPQQARAMQGLAATESAMIRRAEDAARAADFDTARVWLGHAAQVREDAPTVADARERVDAIRHARIAALRDGVVEEIAGPNGLAPPVLRRAREKLADALRIADPGDTIVADLRQRIDLAAYYGRFRPGQAFTDALEGGGRGPEMVVVPHGAFRMGATDDEPGAMEAEKPAHYIRFDRGFAMSRKAVTVAEFRRFVQATGYRPRATRRGHSIVYDERSGNFVRRSGVDWQSDYAGAPAADGQPVLHVSVRDAEAYAAWLGERSGHGYRLPSEAEYEYALRAGRQGRYAWGDDGIPPDGAGNLTGGNDVSPSGRRWNNAFVGYGDGFWGPAPAGSFPASPWGLYDLGSNVSEWVADCWHASYRRAPADGAAWFNPGCRARVIRGGSWASSPSQSRAAWRSSTDSDMTSARIGFRVVRGI